MDSSVVAAIRTGEVAFLGFGFFPLILDSNSQSFLKLEVKTVMLS